ncbi:hypothetical protein MY11210_007294 [Beauveria gryllotalpidicola]
MKIPYNCLHARGGVLFGARGGKIHTFSLADGAHIATWKHPELETCAAAGSEAPTTVANEAGRVGGSAMMDEAEQPPSKRLKVAEDDAPKNMDDDEDEASGKKARGRERRKPKPIPVPDRPVIIQLTTTADGSHLVAVSAHDKAVWVFSHNGSGQLTQLSKRIMPKRPSSIAVSSDDQIIVADKFGDVYAVPLVKSSEVYTPPPQQQPSSSIARKPRTKPAATVLTVHSKGNRAALAAQQREMENPTNGPSSGAKAAVSPDFAHTLLLGHVSMLTALVLGEDAQGRRYIITGDRDEHIRVSRYMPQAHVIHGYCLGHGEFVGAMAVPSARRGLLVSGGGDEDLLVWDWVDGALLSRTSILTPAQQVSPQAAKVAVSRLLALDYPSESGTQTHVVAICEGISAIFTWQLLADDNTLTKPGIIQLPGNPLDIATSTTSSTASIAVALHIPEGSETAAQSLHLIQLMTDDHGRLAVDTIAPVRDDPQETKEQEQDVTEAEVHTLFYTVEHLRKQQASGPEEREGSQQGDAAEE